MPRPQPSPIAPGQESVWDYPRPPRVEPVEARVTIDFGGRRILDTRGALRVLETSHPPVYYLPASDFVDGALVPADGSSFCEWKGSARYYDVRGGDGAVAPRAAWTYPTPAPGFGELRGTVAVYAGPMDRCTVAGRTCSRSPAGSTADG